MNKTLYFGDNLDVLRRRITDESIDLVYLDPPFNSKRDYNAIFRESNGEAPAAQIKAFGDTWQYSQETVRVKEEIDEYALRYGAAKLPAMLQGFEDVLGKNDVTAYLTMMAVRLLELKRVLKPTGSIYLHCDPTASHYLKIAMDVIFGKENFRNEIIWHYRKWSVQQQQFVRNHDVILFYSRTTTSERFFKTLFVERAASTQKRFGNAKIVSGFDETGRRLPSQMEEEESEGVAMDDVWEIGRVPPIKQLYPTQKPEALLERIINVSSKPGDVVLDPFCGCGTAVTTAERLGRNWIGIDITSIAVSLIEKRLRDQEDLKSGSDYVVVGLPVNADEAAELAARDKYNFQFWALTLLGGHAFPIGDDGKGKGKKGADRGMDGLITFRDGAQRRMEKIIVQVKGGQNIGASDIRDLRGTIEREKAALGFYICLAKPTKQMQTEALDAGSYKSELWKGTYPRLQIRTIADLFAGRDFEYPRTGVIGLKGAARASTGQQSTIYDSLAPDEE